MRMTRREKFLEFIEDRMFYGEETTLRTISDELFVEWMTHGGFHLGDAFRYFTLFFGFSGECNISDKAALIKWLNESVEENCHE